MSAESVSAPPLPSNVEAEQAFIGALLANNDVYWNVSGWLKPDHFYDPTHGRVYAAVGRLINANALADTVALKDAMQGDEGLALLGGNQYLVELYFDAPDTVAAPEYARIIHDLALRRALIQEGQEIAAKARDTASGEKCEALIESACSSLFALAEHKQSGGLVAMSDAAQRWLAMAEAAHKDGRGISGLSTGIRSLDAKLGGLMRSDLIVLAGRPSMGKSALALNIAHAAAKSGEPVAFFSLEMSDEQLAGRQLASFTGIGSDVQRQGRTTATEMQELIDAAYAIAGLPLHIDHTGGISVALMRHRCRRMKRTHGLSLVVVDYLQLMSASNRSDNRVQAITEITQGLKALAKELDVTVLALSQLSRAVEQRDDKRPQLSDLRESGSIEQDADVVLFCYRHEYYVERKKPDIDSPHYGDWQLELEAVKGKAEVIIGKQRHGPIGTVDMHFDPVRTRFMDLDAR